MSATAVAGKNNLQIVETSLPGVLIIEPRVFTDPRGFFMETYRQSALAEAGICENFVQDNHSHSSRGVLRGLHYQLRQPQAKLCRVIQGEVLDIAVDVRLGSPHFGKWVGVLLSGENHRQSRVRRPPRVPCRRGSPSLRVCRPRGRTPACTQRALSLSRDCG